MAFCEPYLHNLSLKSDQWLKYARILRGMYKLRDQNHYVIGWRRLSQVTGLPEGVICDRAMELRESGFFDSQSQEIGVVSLTQGQSDRGHVRAQACLIAYFIRRSLSWRIVTILFTLVGSLLLWLVGNVVYDLLKWVLDNTGR